MVPKLLLRGLLAGVLAGLLAFLFARVFGEPLVDQAVAYEETHEQAAAALAHERGLPHHEEPELVSRPVQAGLGLFIATVVYGAALGGFFSLLFAYWNRRTSLRPRATAAVLALLGFVAIALVPFLIYPANPPAIGNHDTIGARTGLFFGVLLISIAAMALAVALARRLAVRWDPWYAVLIGALAYIVVMFATQQLLPEVHEVPPDFSAELLWQFRTVSVGMHVVIWGTLGIAYGILMERFLAPSITRTARQA